MSSDPVISATGLSKAYLIYAQPTDRLLQGIVPRLQRLMRPVAELFHGELIEKTYFSRHWALRPLDFCVGRGETLGVIGRNGSGKSTLLQLVCGTLTPTDGEIRISGKIAALLELGSGFNPEYTGRENVVLNASVLGLSEAQIAARLDDIISFADIGDYLDQPVKTYSSGMAMRLAFAVIAHVDADILVIDEALAVGDAYFQQKCLRWLRQFRESGSVLFCGHDTGAVMNLCQRALWLDQGQLQMIGPAKDVCEAYAASIQAQAMGLSQNSVRIKRAQDPISEPHDANPQDPATTTVKIAEILPPPPTSSPAVFDVSETSSAYGSGLAEIVEANLTAADGTPLSWIEGGERVLLTVRIRMQATIESPIVGFHIKDRLGQPIFGDNTFLTYAEKELSFERRQLITTRFGFAMPNLASGRYSITAAIASGTLDVHVQHHWLHDALFFDVHSRYRNGVMIAIPMHEISVTVEEPFA